VTKLGEGVRCWWVEFNHNCVKSIERYSGSGLGETSMG
jgi:hypothetical protein